MGKHIIEDLEFVECPYCIKGISNQFKMIHWKHLQKLHGKTIDDVIVEFPGHPTMTLTEANKKKQSAIIGGEKSKESHSLVKTIKCIHCGTVLVVKNNEANKQSCTFCLEQGLENPDGRTKNTANSERSKTLQKKYGVNNAANIPGVTEKKIETCEFRYGGVGFASEELAKKARKTIVDKFGSDNIMKTDEGVLSLIQTFQEKYGEDITNPLHIFEIKNKMMESARKYYKNNDHITKGKTYEEIHGIEKANELRKQRRISGAYGYLKSVEGGYQGPSKPQLDLFNLVKEIFPSAVLDQENYSYILDIAIPEYKLAIEYDGSYWHNDDHDRTRDLLLESFGWKTLRFRDYVPTSEELIQKIEEIIN